MMTDVIVLSCLIWSCFVLVNFSILLSAIAVHDDGVLVPLDCRTKSFLFAVMGFQAMIGRAIEQRLETVGRWHLTLLVGTGLIVVLFPNSPLWLLRAMDPRMPWAVFAVTSSLALSFPVGAALIPSPPTFTDLRSHA